MSKKNRLNSSLLPLLLVLAGTLLVLGVRGDRLTAANGDGQAGAALNGDVNGSGVVDISDAVYILEWLFLGGPGPVPILAQSSPPATGQTNCHDGLGNEIPCDTPGYLGQDGLYRAGCGGPQSARFIDNGDGTVTDSCTGLMWQQVSGLELGKTWQETLQESEALILCMDGTWTTSAQEASAHGGVKHDDWRLPNVRELETILDYGKVDPACDPSISVQPAGYWTSTTYAEVPAEAWCINLYQGKAEPIGKTAKLKVITVRGGR